jgi:hypothetical protein
VSSTYISQFSLLCLSAQSSVLVLYAGQIDNLCSAKDLVIQAEYHERQMRRLEHERDAMEAKYEVCDCLAIRFAFMN